MNQRTSYHHGDLKSALIQEALQILEKVGQSELSLRALADAVGVSPGAPYRHFADKTALMGALAAEGFRRLHNTLQACAPETGAGSQPTPTRRLKAMILAYVDLAKHNPALYHLMFSAHGYSLKSEDCQMEGAAAFGLLAEAVAAAQAAGYKTEVPLNNLILSIWAYLHGWAGFVIDDLILPGFKPPHWFDAGADFLGLPD